MNKQSNDITIDNFEIQILLDYCWADGTALQSSILTKAINIWYYKLRQYDREVIYEHLTTFKKREDEKHKRLKIEVESKEIQEMLIARFDPYNQYNIYTTEEKQPLIEETFMYSGKYWAYVNTFVDPDKIKEVVKIEFKPMYL